MSQGETLISILLALIAYFLYQIAKQLSYLTGKRIKFGLRIPKFTSENFKKKKVEEDTRKLPN